MNNETKGEEMSLAGVSLRDLEYAVAVADLGHFGRAAEECGVSQPALSAQIKRLETSLGVTLFERTRRGTLMTKAGTVVIGHARKVIAAAQMLVAAAKGSITELKGVLRLGAIPTVGPYLLPYVLRPIRTGFPGIHLIFSEGQTAELITMLETGALDAVLVCAPVEEPSLILYDLYYEPFVLAHPPAQTVRWPLPDRGEELVLLEEGHCLRDHTLNACGPVVPRAKRHATGLEMLRHMVAAGDGISLMPSLAANALGELPGLLRYSPVPDKTAGRTVVLAVRRSDPREPHFARFAAIIRDGLPPSVQRKNDAAA